MNMLASRLPDCALGLRSVRTSSPQFVVNDRLYNRLIHLRPTRQPRDLGGNLGPVKEACSVPRGTSTSHQALSHIIGPILILLDQSSCIGLPKQSKRPPMFDPATNSADHG